MLPLNIDRRRPTPLSEQVEEQIRHAIGLGLLRPGARLPSSRRLAGELEISRNTVVLAYERLLADGWLEAGVGRGTFVAAAPPRGGAAPPTSVLPASSAAAPFSWHHAVVRDCPPPVTRREARSPSLGEPVSTESPESEPIDLAGAVPSPHSYPVEILREIFDRVLREAGRDALGYGPPAGYRPLREWIAERASRDGRRVGAEEVLIVGGSQQGLDLIARLLLRPGDEVLVESPTYSNALQLWRLHGARVRGVAMDRRGLRPDALAAVLERTQPKLVYLMPTFQNPTGLTLDGDRRRAVMEVLQAHQVPVVEDEFDAELRFEGAPEPPLSSFDRGGQVIQLGTFSKILCPGFRIGWIIAPPPVFERLLDVKRIVDLSTSLPAQMAIAELCRSGELDRHLERARREHAERLRAMLRAIERELPPSVGFTRPAGGMTLWLTLPAGVRAREVAELLREQGVEVAPGDWFFADGTASSMRGEHLRLSFVGESTGRIRQGIEILGAVLARYLERRVRAPRIEETVPFV